VQPPVAASYAELQSLPRLFAAVRQEPKPKPGTEWQAVRALFQAIEVTLVNLEILALKATSRLADGDEEGATRALEWMVCFGRAWEDLAWRIGDVGPLEPPQGHRIEVMQSLNWRALTGAEKSLVRELKVRADEPGPHAWGTPMLRYVMLQRVAMEYSAIDGAPHGYAEFVRPEGTRAAVLERTLPGDTVFMQFRAAHQLPELLVDVVNDHLELAINRPETGILHRAERLMDGVVGLTEILVPRLRTEEYHDIREALGLTSGSHSVGLHFHLMRDLYPSLAKATKDAPNEVRLLIRSLGRHIDRWRLEHINLPRTNLGGAGTGTRSLTGSPDALQTVAKMREAGRARDPFSPQDRPFRATAWESDLPPLAEVERRLLTEIAQETQNRFTDVQDRTGRYADPPGFAAPPSRRRT
jgi:hypothetical protein